MLCLGGLGLCFWMSVEVSCPARRQSNHYLTAEAPPCCCEARPVAAGSCCSATLQRSLSVVVGCLGNGRLHQQWACISVGAGCLSNCRLRQQWACVSVRAGCLGNGEHPSPTERLRSRHGGLAIETVWNRCFVCPTAVSHTLCPCNPLGWPTAQVPFSLEFSPLKSQVAVSTGHPYKRTLWGSLGRAGRCYPGCRLLQAEPPPGVLHLLYTLEFPRSVGNKDQSENAAPTDLSAD